MEESIGADFFADIHIYTLFPTHIREPYLILKSTYRECPVILKNISIFQKSFPVPPGGEGRARQVVPDAR